MYTMNNRMNSPALAVFLVTAGCWGSNADPKDDLFESESDPGCEVVDTDSPSDSDGDTANPTPYPGWEDETEILRLGARTSYGQVNTPTTEGSQLGYSSCAGYGWTCFGAYGSIAGDGALHCWNGAPAGEDTSADLIITGIGVAGLQCEVVEDPSGIPHAIFSSEYAPGPDGTVNAGHVHVVPLLQTEPVVAATDVEVIGLLGDGLDAWLEVETVPGYNEWNHFCFGNSSVADGATAGLYCFTEDEFWALASGSDPISIVDAGGQLFRFSGLGGDPEWPTFDVEPLPSGSGLAISDPRFNRDGATGFNGKVILFNADGTQRAEFYGREGEVFGMNMQVIPHEGGHGLLVFGPVSEEATYIDLATNTVQGRIRGPVHSNPGQRRASEWGYSSDVIRMCNGRYVLGLGSPKGQRGDDVPGMVQFYYLDDFMELVDAESGPVPFTTVFGPASPSGNFGRGLRLVPDQTDTDPLDRRWTVGNPEQPEGYSFTLHHLRR